LFELWPFYYEWCRLFPRSMLLTVMNVICDYFYDCLNNDCSIMNVFDYLVRICSWQSWLLFMTIYVMTILDWIVTLYLWRFWFVCVWIFLTNGNLADIVYFKVMNIIFIMWYGFDLISHEFFSFILYYYMFSPCCCEIAVL